VSGAGGRCSLLTGWNIIPGGVDVPNLLPLSHNRLAARDIVVLPVNDIARLAVISALGILTSLVSNQSRDIGAAQTTSFLRLIQQQASRILGAD